MNDTRETGRKKHNSRLPPLLQNALAWRVERALLSDPIDCVHMCLPSGLINQSALQDLDLDASKIELAFAAGFHDYFLHEAAQAFWSLSEQQSHFTDRLLVDWLTAALTAHVIRQYTINRWKPKEMPRALDEQRLKRVLTYIEANSYAPLALRGLATEACLSPFHFSSLSKQTTGRSPRRYVADRRVLAANSP